jgi:hypothetical protein
VRPKPAKHGSEPEPKQVKHGNKVIADPLAGCPAKLLISQPDRIVTRDNTSKSAIDGPRFAQDVLGSRTCFPPNSAIPEYHSPLSRTESVKVIACTF